MIEFALPGKEELGAVLGGIMESANIKTMEAEIRDKVIDAASGLTTIEAENAFERVHDNRGNRDAGKRWDSCGNKARLVLKQAS